MQNKSPDTELSKKSDVSVPNIVVIVAIFVCGILLLSMTNTKPTPETSSIKSAKITHLSNAYFTNDNILSAITTNRHKVNYVVMRPFDLDKSGNASVYTFFEKTNHTYYVIPKGQLQNVIDNNEVREQLYNTISNILAILIVIPLVILFIIFVVISSKKISQIENN